MPDLKTFRGGIHPDEHKEMSLGHAVVRYLPVGDMVFPLSQHIGRPAKPIVKRGDAVLAGQIIAEADGFVSANVISSCSGTVKCIEDRTLLSGAKCPCIVVENDHQFIPAIGVGKTVRADEVSNQDILDAIKAAGIVGMGGAGFPTHVKLMPKKPESIEYIIANGCECEPFITCDDRLMQDQSLYILEGLRLVMQLFPNARGVIAIEDNKHEAISKLENICSAYRNIDVQPLVTKYPQGGERNLISVVAGRDIKAGQLPAEVGVVVCNVATLCAIYRAVCKSEPLMERYVTVTGDAVANPRTMLVRIGTSASELIQAAGGIKESVTAKKMLCGGPMMGIAMSTAEAPVCKANNALTILAEDDVEIFQPQMTACIRCGRCVQVCPVHLMPQMMAEAVERGDLERFKKLYGMDCFNCGSCTYICPSRRPLMELFKHGKALVAAAARKE